MKKNFAVIFALLFSLLVCSCAYGISVDINAENFPDEMFRSYVSYIVDADENGILTDDEIEVVTAIAAGELGISSLKGIEYFTALGGLECCSNDLKELDLSANTNLVLLSCQNNSLDKLDLSNNPIAFLNCSDNNIKAIRFSSISSQLLEELYCDNNQIESLDLSGFNALKILTCSNNMISSLNLSGTSSLSGIDCSMNQLRELDLSGHESLLEVICHTNKIKE